MIIARQSTIEMIKLYDDGYSFGDIAKMYGLTRQAVWERLSRRKKEFKARKKKMLPFVVVDGIKFTANTNGYYRATFRTHHLSLHRYVYEKKHGVLPDDWDVHHKDGNRQNNKLSNLVAMSKSDHTRFHQLEKNHENKKI